MERTAPAYTVESVNKGDDIRGLVLEVRFVPGLIQAFFWLDGPVEI